MTDNTPIYFSYISKAELAKLHKSHAALRGWGGRYRREIAELESRYTALDEFAAGITCTPPDDIHENCNRRIAGLEAQAKKCIWCGAVHERGMNTLCPLTIAESQIAAVKGLRKQNYHHRGINQKFVWVHELEAALSRSNG